jgi:thiol-disulfide isomerase/thioredoxin
MRALRVSPVLLCLVSAAAFSTLPSWAGADDEIFHEVPEDGSLPFPGLSGQDEDTCGVDKPCGPEEGGSRSAAPEVESSPVQGEAVCLHFWYAPGCPHCRRVEKYVRGLGKNRYPSLEIRRHDAKEETDLYSGLLSEYEVPQSKCGRVPVVFVGGRYCVGEKECYESLVPAIDECLTDGCKCAEPTKKSALKVGFVGIASLAAVDAVNVCALAVLVILITAVLTRFPGNRKRMLRIAFSFMGGIFSAYFLVGICIVLGFKSLAGLGSLSTTWVYRCVGVIAILLGLFNLKDCFWYGGCGFKLEIPERWRPKMKKAIESTISPPGAYLVGLLVSTFLLPCALGPYFVASGLLSGLPVFYAVPWLFLYNVVFILPMMIITLAVYGGFAAISNIEEWRQKNIKKLHLVAGMILCAVGAAIVGGLI